MPCGYQPCNPRLAHSRLKLVETHKGSSPKRSSAAFPAGLGSVSWCGTVSWCPQSDVPALILHRALKAELAAEAALPSPKGWLEGGCPAHVFRPLCFFVGFVLPME